jgi:ligand-binding SRPBCC domain-containing protein
MKAPIAMETGILWPPVAPATFEITTRLAAPADRVWQSALSEEGIDYELGPWLRMTMPKGVGPGATIDDVPVGEELGRSWVLLARFLPVEYDDLRLAERGPGLRFLERSRLASASSWQHEREVVPVGDDECEITDRLELEPRAPLRAIGGARLAEGVVRRIFTHRHRRLAERWGRA